MNVKTIVQYHYSNLKYDALPLNGLKQSCNAHLTDEYLYLWWHIQLSNLFHRIIIIIILHSGWSDKLATLNV